MLLKRTHKTDQERSKVRMMVSRKTARMEREEKPSSNQSGGSLGKRGVSFTHHAKLGENDVVHSTAPLNLVQHHNTFSINSRDQAHFCVSNKKQAREEPDQSTNPFSSRKAVWLLQALISTNLLAHGKIRLHNRFSNKGGHALDKRRGPSLR